MYVDFNKVFKSKSQTQYDIPPALVKYLSRFLPKGLTYRAIRNGNCVAVSTSESCNIGGFRFEPTADQKKILGKNYSVNDILSYSYNSQRAIPLKLAKEGIILFNNQELPIDKILYNPYNPIKSVSGNFYMEPEKFPDPFPIQIGGAGFKKMVLVQRIPNESITTAAYESDPKSALCIQYFVDNKTQKIKFNLYFYRKNAKNIRDLLESILIYNAFLDGEGTICEQPLGIKLESPEVKRIDVKSINFLKKLRSIEECLEVTFTPPQGEIDYDTMCLVEQLYQNLINHVPVRNLEKINSININTSRENPYEKFEALIGRPFFFEFELTTGIDLYDVKLSLPTIVGFFNAILKDITYIDDNNSMLTFIDENEAKERYTSSMYFKTIDELKAFKSDKHDKIISDFRDAKLLYKYLN